MRRTPGGVAGAPGVKVVAVSRDLRSLGLRRGAGVRIEGLWGEFFVLGMMPGPWKWRIDRYLGNDVRAAQAWGRKRAKVR